MLFVESFIKLMLSKNNEEHLWADKRVKGKFLLQV